MKYGKTSAAAISVLLPFAVYVYTAAPGLTLIDSGEFILACRTLGIPHPPGVPTYVLLGHIFSVLPIATEIARRTNLFSAFCAALSAGVVYLLIFELLRDIDYRLALAGALAWGFSLSLWHWATITEVYALNILLLAIVYWLAARGQWAWTALVAGLALGVHHATILAALPAGVFLLWNRRWPSAREICWTVGAGLAGLSVYLYIPLRARQSPLLSWGSARDLEHFWWHVSGREYQATLMSAGPEDLLNRQVEFFALWSRQMTWIGFLVMLAGIVALALRRRDIAVFTGLVISLNLALVWISGLGGVDIAGYYLPAFLAGSWCFAAGAEAILEWLGALHHRLGVAAMLAIALLPAGLNFPASNRRHEIFAPRFMENNLRGVAPGALILSSNWDFLSGWYYWHFVQGHNWDVDVLDSSLLHRVWYLDYIEVAYPHLAHAVTKEIAVYRTMLDRFEHGDAVDTVTMERSYVGLIDALVRNRTFYGREVYRTPDLERELDGHAPLVPHGLLFRYGPAKFEDIPLDLTGLDGLRTTETARMRGVYSTMLTERYKYLQTTEHRAPDREALAMALRLNPKNREAARLMEDLSK